VLRVHGGPATDLVSDKPELRRHDVDVADLPGVSGVARREAALRAEDGGKGSMEIAVETGRFGLHERRKVVEEVPRHAINRQSAKQYGAIELRQESILDRLGVRVGVDYFAEEIVRALWLWVVCVRHRGL